MAKPIVVSGKRMVKKINALKVQILVQWTNIPRKEATFESYYDVKKQFPYFDPWVQGFAVGGVM